MNKLNIPRNSLACISTKHKILRANKNFLYEVRDDRKSLWNIS